jgi:hypothetical protein
MDFFLNRPSRRCLKRTQEKECRLRPFAYLHAKFMGGRRAISCNGSIVPAVYDTSGFYVLFISGLSRIDCDQRRN